MAVLISNDGINLDVPWKASNIEDGYKVMRQLLAYLCLDFFCDDLTAKDFSESEIEDMRNKLIDMICRGKKNGLG